LSFFTHDHEKDGSPGGNGSHINASGVWEDKDVKKVFFNWRLTAGTSGANQDLFFMLYIQTLAKI